MSHIYTRLLWLAFGVGFGAYLLWLGVFAHQIGLSLSGIGLVLLGAVWFLTPVLLTSPIHRSTLTSMAAAIGPQRTRTVLTSAAFLCLTFGIVLRYAFKV
jgi:multisubunit Na+/H+ antiporter MnhG subunit